MRTGTGNFGFDDAKGVYVDLMEAGIIDATKVVRIALDKRRIRRQHAASGGSDAHRDPRTENSPVPGARSQVATPESDM